MCSGAGEIQAPSIGHWTVNAESKETKRDQANATTRLSGSQFLKDKVFVVSFILFIRGIREWLLIQDLRREISKTQGLLLSSASSNGGFINLRNKLDKAAHVRTVSLINHEKGQIARTVDELKTGRFMLWLAARSPY